MVLDMSFDNLAAAMLVFAPRRKIEWQRGFRFTRDGQRAVIRKSEIKKDVSFTGGRKFLVNLIVTPKSKESKSLLTPIVHGFERRKGGKGSYVFNQYGTTYPSSSSVDSELWTYHRSTDIAINLLGSSHFLTFMKVKPIYGTSYHQTVYSIEMNYCDFIKKNFTSFVFDISNKNNLQDKVTVKLIGYVPLISSFT